LFLSQGCAACHGPSAHGTQFAPSLINVGKKFPGDKLPYLLHHPTAKMKAGGMPTVALPDQQFSQLIAYLDSLTPESTPPPMTSPAEQATRSSSGGSAPEASGRTSVASATPAAVPAQLSPLELQGQKIFQSMTCETCHGVGGLHGTVAAPPLAGTASLLPADVLENLLRHHTRRMQQGGMPLTNLNAPDMKALVAYIRSMPSQPN
jgi:mono/diheme cytochrome c family protein